MATVGATLFLIALGGVVRATDSGLACPDWPRCFGQWVPPADVNIWIEHTHRLVAGVVGLMTAALVVWAVARFRQRGRVLWPAVAALVLVVVQAALGALVVLHLLRAELVTAHLGMAMLVVGGLVLVAVNVSADRPQGRRDLRFARKAAVVTGLSFAQILVGGHVTGIAAGLVWTDFPLMGGSVLPALATERELFHFAHRALAFVLLAAAVWLAAAALAHRRSRQVRGEWSDERRWLVRLPMWAATLVVAQIGLGVANLWTNASTATVIPHLAVASWIWTVLVLTTALAYRDAPLAQLAQSDAGEAAA